MYKADPIVSQGLAERDQETIWHPFTQMETAPPPIPIVKGSGAWLIAENGQRYLDMVSSWWVNLHGHAHPYIARRLYEQLRTLEHVIFAGFTHAPAVELAERLLKILPQNQRRIFFTDDGSSAVEVALKMAIQYWYNHRHPRKTIVALRGAYHGDTFGAMSVSGRGTFTRPFNPYLFDVIYIDVPVPGKEEEVLDEFRKILQQEKDISAFIFEPLVQGTAGMVMYQPEILDRLIGMAHEHEIICIADEVMTGFGRTGRLFASDYLVNKPDIICMSKGITGGYMPLGVTSCSQKIYDAFLSTDKTKSLFHGHSYTGNPLACTAALASMDLLLSPECTSDIRRISTAHETFALQIEHHPRVESVRCRGTIMALTVRTGEGSSYFSSIRDYMYNFFLDRNILLRPLGEIIYLIPPYCVKDAELEMTYSAIREMLDSLS